jgi:hypothetical protein
MPEQRDEFVFRVDKSKWTEEDRRSYMEQPWGVRRVIDLLGWFPGIGKWFARREIAKIDARLAEHEKVSAKVDEFLAETRKKRPLARGSVTAKQRTPEEVHKDVEDVRELVKNNVEVRAGLVGNMTEIILEKEGKAAAQAWAMKALRNRTGDEIQEMSLHWKPEIAALVAECLKDDERFK